MASRLVAGDEVQTPLGKGIVREVRGQGWLLIDINGRSVMFEPAAVGLLDPKTAARAKKKTRLPPAEPSLSSPGPAPRAHQALREIDLHGLTVQEALSRVEAAVNDALLADRSELRVIHGRGSGRIRAALHRWLQGVASVRAFRLDPGNPGVTIVRF